MKLRSFSLSISTIIRPALGFSVVCGTRQVHHKLRFSSTGSVISRELSSRKTEKPDTLVVGGGLAGLATAAALRNIANIDAIRVVESKDDALANESAGAAIQLGPNAFKALKIIGGEKLLERIYETGSTLIENLILLPGGAPPMAIPNTAAADTDFPIVLIRWGVLRKLLGELIPQEYLFFGRGDVLGYYIDTEDTSVKALDKEGKEIVIEPTFSPQLIVGADGLNSFFRDRVQSGKMMPENDLDPTCILKDNGRVNIKAVAPVELKKLGEDYAKEGATYAQFDQQVAGFAGPAGKGYTYWAISVADDPESGDKFLSHISNNKTVAKNELLDKLKASSSDASNREWLISLVEQTDPSAILINRSLEAPIEADTSFVSNDGRIVLVGDAAHAMNPSYGQSASFSFEDAATLALLLKEGNGDVTDVLKEYSDKRVGRCMEMQRRSEERAAKAMKGETTEDVSKWIYDWKP